MIRNLKANRLRRSILCLAGILFTATGAFALNPNITLSRYGNTTVSVSQAIQYIEQQTGFHVSYNKNSLDTSRKLSVTASMPLEELLDRVAAGNNVRYIVQGDYIAFVPSNDNSRPQVRREPTPRRTRDTYDRNPAALDASPQPRRQQAPVNVNQEPTVPLYSDYRSIESYNIMNSGRPRFALKTNLLYGAAALTPNIAAEVALGPRSTAELSYSNNPWNYKAQLPSNRKLLHGIVSAEYRYWLCERFSGHFFGVNALYSEYNVSEYNIPSMFEKEYRYHGNAWGGGITYGYALPVGKRWNLEFTAGVDVLRMNYDRYSCLTCATDAEPQTKTWFGPTNLGINLVFLIK